MDQTAQQLGEQREQEFAKAAAPEEVAPGIQEQKEAKPDAPEIKPEVDEPEVKAPSLDKDIGETVEKKYQKKQEL